MNLIRSGAKVGQAIIQSVAAPTAAIPQSLHELFDPRAKTPDINSPFMRRLLGESKQESIQTMVGHAAANEPYPGEGLLGTFANPTAKWLAISPTAKKYGFDKAAPFLAVGSVLGDAYLNAAGFGDSAAERQLIKQLVHETDLGIIGGHLRRAGFPPEIADKIAPDIAAAKTPAHVDDALKVGKAITHAADTAEELHPGVMHDTALEDLRPAAVADWEANYVPRMEELDARYSALEEPAKRAPLAEHTAYAAERNAIEREATTIENEFVAKYSVPRASEPTIHVPEEPKPAEQPELLAEEAKKYGSAEEFVRAQDIQFHGTSPDFQLKKVQPGDLLFTDDRAYAQGISSGNGSHIFEAKVNIKNPFIYDAQNEKVATPLIKAIIKKNDLNQEKNIYSKYDGLIIKNVGKDGQTWTVPFKKEQVTSKSQLTDFYNKTVKQAEPSGHLEGVDLEQATKLSPEAAEPIAIAAADRYWDEVIQPEIDQGGPIVIGADDLKDHFGGDYNDNNHPVYSRAAFKLYERALTESKSPDVVLTGGGPGSGKTEILVKSFKLDGYQGIVYDSTMVNEGGVTTQVGMARDAGKEVEIYGIIPNLHTARTFTILREQRTGRGISDKTFSHAHAGFPATAKKLLETGVIAPEHLHLLDLSTKGRISLEETRALVRKGAFVDDPLALLQTKQYNATDLASKYGKERFVTPGVGGPRAVRPPEVSQEPGPILGPRGAPDGHGPDAHATGDALNEPGGTGAGPQELLQRPQESSQRPGIVPSEEGAPVVGTDTAHVPERTEAPPMSEDDSLDLAAKQHDEGDFALRDTRDQQAARNLEAVFADLHGVDVRDLHAGFTPEDLANAKTELEVAHEVLLDHPGRPLMKYVSQQTGDLPELGAKTGPNRGRSNSKFAREGDTLVQNLIGQEASGGGDVVHAQELVDDYRALKERVDGVKRTFKEIRDKITLEKQAGTFVAAGQRRLAQEASRDLEALHNLISAAERAGYRRGTEASQHMLDDMIGRLKSRRLQLERVQQAYNLSDRQFAKILGRKDPRFMEGDAYAKWLEGVNERGARARRSLDRYGPLKTPGEDLIDAGGGEMGDGTWQSLVKNWYKNAGKKEKVGILDYLTTPEYVLDRLGLGDISEAIHDAHDAYIRQRDVEIGKIDDWRKQAGTRPDASKRIFQWLDGEERFVQHEMSPGELAVAKDIRAYLKDWAARLNLPDDNRIAKYITHLFEPGMGAPEGATIFDDPELAAIMRTKVATSVYDPFLEKRLGKKGYKQDTWGALDAYVKRATRKEAVDPVLERMLERAKGLDQSVYDYLAKYSHRINMRPTDVDKLIDNTIKSVTNRYGDRPFAYLSNKIRAGFYRGTLGLNVASALRNLSQGANTYAKLGERYTMVGYAKIAWKLAARDLGELESSGVLGDRYIQDQKVGIYKTALQKLDPVLFSLFEAAEKINRGAAFYGAKAKALGKGLDEEQAVKYAKRMVRETQFAFSTVDTPIAMSDDAMKILTQLQSYNIKQVEFFARMLRNKEYAGLVRWTLATVVFVNTVGKLFGMNLEQVIPSVSIGGAPGPAGLSAIKGYITAKTPQEKQAALKQIKRLIFSRIPAGAQLSKTMQGLTVVSNGKDVTAAGKTRYTVEPTTEKYLQAGIFGKSALPEAQDYYDSIFNPTSTTPASTGPPPL